MVADRTDRLNRQKLTRLPPALTMRRILANGTVFKSALFVGGVFVALIVVGSLFSSGPSEATIAADRQPTTTTTTEAPPEGVVVVHIDNGVLRPSNLEIDIEVIQIVKWINDDDRVFILEASDGAFVSPPLSQGDTFEFDYSTLPTALYRYKAVLDIDSLFGGVRIPGLVDTRPAQ
jgi:hypothetical protein